MGGWARCTRRGLWALLWLTLRPPPTGWRVQVAWKGVLERDSRSWRSVYLRSRAPSSLPLLRHLQQRPKTPRHPLLPLCKQITKQTPPPFKRPSPLVSRRCKRSGLPSAQRRRRMRPLLPRPYTPCPLSPTTLAAWTWASREIWT
ncbi:hypothetical protein DFH06DRAFT_1247851 [Mycena polygramma]|nr:hypothetical protein DFH06DRAFT_1247851 [Mycena polygramma]